MNSPPRLASSRLPFRRGDDDVTDGGDVSPGTTASGGGNVLEAVTSRANNESSATIVGGDGSAEMNVVGGSPSGVIGVGVVSSSPKKQLGDSGGPRTISVTLPNIADVAAFVEANEAYAFDFSYRPVALTVHVLGQGCAGRSGSDQGHQHVARSRHWTR